MIFYRITKREFSDQLFASGRPNRWNAAGDYVLYTASSRSLATLELLVHRSGIEMKDSDFVILVIEVSDKAKTKTLKVENLPQSWRSLKGYSSTQQIGHQWVESRKELLLQVPSVVIPQEYNIVINTEHPQCDKLVKILEVESFAFDRRLL